MEIGKIHNSFVHRIILGNKQGKLANLTVSLKGCNNSRRTSIITNLCVKKHIS